MSESSIVTDVLRACAHRKIQILDPRMWVRGLPPPFRADDKAIIGVAYRQNTGLALYGDKHKRAVRFGIPGQPDIAGIFRGGQPFALEVKMPKGRLNPCQDWYNRFFGGLGLWIATVRSYDEAGEVLDTWIGVLKHDRR